MSLHFQKMLVISFPDYYINNADNKYYEKGSKTSSGYKFNWTKWMSYILSWEYDAFANYATVLKINNLVRQFQVKLSELCHEKIENKMYTHGIKF